MIATAKLATANMINKVSENLSKEKPFCLLTS